MLHTYIINFSNLYCWCRFQNCKTFGSLIPTVGFSLTIDQTILSAVKCYSSFSFQVDFPLEIKVFFEMEAWECFITFSVRKQPFKA